MSTDFRSTMLPLRESIEKKEKSRKIKTFLNAGKKVVTPSVREVTQKVKRR